MLPFHLQLSQHKQVQVLQLIIVVTPNKMFTKLLHILDFEGEFEEPGKDRLT